MCEEYTWDATQFCCEKVKRADGEEAVHVALHVHGGEGRTDEVDVWGRDLKTVASPISSDDTPTHVRRGWPQVDFLKGIDLTPR